MHRLATASLLFPLLLAAVGAQAASTAELKVAGVVKPPACSINLGDGGLVDFGDIPASSLKAGSATDLPSKSIPLNINCNAPTKVSMLLKDNVGYSGEVSLAGSNRRIVNSQMFRLKPHKTANGAVNVGAMMLRIPSASVSADGQPAKVLTHWNDHWSVHNDGWIINADAPMFGDYRYRLGFSASGTKEPGALKSIASTLEVAVTIVPAGNLPTATDTIYIVGSVTLELRYE